jgi:CheY-like chemotaxis protein/two-component sensor histidine kinase
MAAGMGHEINNPLTYIMANVSLSLEATARLTVGFAGMRTAGASADEVALLQSEVDGLETVLSEAQEGAERVRKIVHDLRTFSRIDDASRKVIDVRDVLNTAIKMTDNEVRHHAVLTKDYGPISFVEANAGQLTQVFVILILNAAQSITLGRADTERIQVVTRTDPDGSAVVEVRDTGCGIPPENVGRLFDPFFTTKAVGAGTGLGLAIAHALVGALGGRIRVQSVRGQGATFVVSLPAATGGLALPSDPPPHPIARRRGRILVVDDEYAIGECINRMLNAHHSVTIETDARKALARLVGGETFDLIFCDLMMPNMTGMDFYEQVALSLPHQRERVVFLSGGAFAGRAKQFASEGMPSEMLAKPFSINAIRSTANRYVDRELPGSAPLPVESGLTSSDPRSTHE